jgi:hypothetical protein
VGEGWTWLIRVGKQLESAADLSNGTQFQECCISLLLFLRQGSAALIVRFGWKTVEKVLQAVRTVTMASVTAPTPTDKKGFRDSDACKQLVAWLDSAIQTEGVKCAVSLRHHEPHVMASYLIIRCGTENSSPLHIL